MQHRVKPLPWIKRNVAEEMFDTLWRCFDQRYPMFVIRPEVNWNHLREQFLPQVSKSKTAYEFAAVCASLLRPLRDLHVTLRIGGAQFPIFNRRRLRNVNRAGIKSLLGDLNDEGAGIQWIRTRENVGYLFIQDWLRKQVPAACNQALYRLRMTKALVLDVRLNQGGNEDFARDVAGLFLPNDFVYAHHRFRNGPNHFDLTEKMPRTAKPNNWRYKRPVVLLIGEMCASSNESFVAMMGGDPEAVTMGANTCGSSGNPVPERLSAEITVTVPRWIDYLPNGKPVNEFGIEPRLRFSPSQGAFSGSRDDLLRAALIQAEKLSFAQDKR